MESKIMNSGNLTELRPLTRSITFTGRPYSSSCRSLSRGSSSSSLRSSLRSSVISVPDPNLSVQDIERILYQRVNEIQEDLKNAFSTLDVDQTFTVTKGQLYRVLKNFIIPLTQPQFEELLRKIPVLDNGTIPYLEFLAQFHRAGTSGTQVKRRWSCSQANQVMTLNELETRLKQMISKNLKNFVRSCRLFDYNQNGQIQKHELRRVLENYCFKMKNVEYEKFWNHYCIGKKHTMDYKELLRNLGINVEQQNKPGQESVAQALNWEATTLELEKQKMWRSPSSRNGFNTEDCTLEDLEKVFRKKISSFHPDLVKAFRSFDVDHTGCVPLDSFKSIINNFVFPLSDRTFHELMSRFRFKTTDPISWEDFLQRFRRPAGIENGQTLPMKSNHRVNSVKAKDLHFSNDHILQKLHQHFQEAYPSLKQAFLVLDEGRNGRVSRKELRRIVDCMMFRITDEQFKELMIILDPEHTGFISYHQFLDLFEEKESVTGHKWLNNTRQPAKETPVVLSVDTVESILRDNITTHWKDLSKAVQACDTKGSGIVSRDQLKRILQSYCPSVSEDHFQMIFDQYNYGSSDCVPFIQFFRDLGVSVSCAGDINGISTDILERNQFQEELRQFDHSDRMREIENQASNLIRKITVDEVIDKLKDCVTKHEFSLKESFLACNKQPNGKITKKDFRKVLQDHELHLEEEQFNALTEKLGFTKEGLSYLDFVSLFEVPSGDGPAEKLHNSPNHRVNKTKCRYMTAEECLSQLLDKLREGYGDTYSAFYKIDSNRDGLITMHDFRRLLDSFMFIITQKEYERLLNLLGLNLMSTLNYMEFLNLLRRQEKEDCPPWLNSFYRPKQSQDCADLACEQAHYYLLTKAQGRWHDLAKTFCEIDSDGNGIIQKKDLRNVLYRFSLPITKSEFEKLWHRYDPEGRGHLTHQEFLQKLGVNFASGDSGPSKRIIEDNYQTLEKHYSSQQKINKEMQEFHKHQTRSLNIKDIEQQIKDKFREYYPDFSAAFTKIDKNKDGLITVNDFRQMLEDLNFHLDDDQFLNLLYRLRLRILDNKLSYFDFLKMIDDGRASKYGQRQEMIMTTENVQNLIPQKVLVKLKESVKNSQEELHKAFSAFDKDDTGTIKPFELHRILDSFCFKLTDKQFKYVLSKLALNKNDTIDWRSFLHNFSNFTAEPVSTWVERVERATRPRTGQELTMKDIVTHIQEVIAARFYSITKDLFNIDYAGINVISKEDFQEFFHKNFMLLTEEQFDILWSMLPLNPYGNLKYHDFLKMFSNEVPTTPLPLSRNAEPNYKLQSSVTQGRTSMTRRPKTAPSTLNKPSTPALRPHTAAPLSAPMINCEQVENKLKSKVSKCWQDIHRACREKDLEKEGHISSTDFSAVLRQFNMDISEEELENLTLKYDLRNNGKVSYSDFLRNVTLGTTPQKNALLQRMKLQKPRIPVSTGLYGPYFLDAMLRIQPKILSNWRAVRRTFQTHDETRSGYINIQDFKQVLRKIGVNLSEDEFFHIFGYFDKDLKSKISYNDFLSEFLK
ncbi:EF-hand calcium-binding domain-containing protein 6 [Bufo gargarizans]|uniref:EF-hand calcium-binding domain-containing protein 6 n=1 Tax=Bufo gargarizans TaxID=30331 RepID=UPI001CF5B522|nr:EF-hand calcium-binding domain-containing protein 6 [Bufo gargarizans]XP_044133779.1 EF-hand calcium-binding domain-containing protein 6 [Bufo gargarizans]